MVFLRNIENSMDLKNQIKINIKNISGIPGRALSVWDATYNLYWHRWNFMFRFSLKNKRKNDDVYSLSHFFWFLLILIFFIFLKKNDGETMDPDAFALSIPNHKSKLSLSSPRQLAYVPSSFFNKSINTDRKWFYLGLRNTTFSPGQFHMETLQISLKNPLVIIAECSYGSLKEALSKLIGNL